MSFRIYEKNHLINRGQCSCQIQIETENYIELLSSFKKQIYLKVIFNTIGNRDGGTGGTDRGYLGTPIFWGFYREKNGK